jgi:hypothetical protein
VSRCVQVGAEIDEQVDDANDREIGTGIEVSDIAFERAGLGELLATQWWPTGGGPPR